MKLTKRQLKRIIREEKIKLLRETYGGRHNAIEEQINELMEEWIAANPQATPEETMQYYYRLSGEMRGF